MNHGGLSDTSTLPGGAIVRSIVDQNLGVYSAAPSRLQEDVSQEAQVASDYRGRLVYELLQNADDAMAEGGSSDRVRFVVTHDSLTVANTGRALSEGDVQGLCGLGASSKVRQHGERRASIGHKGLGFKSVLEVTDSPEVWSPSCSFGLGVERARGPIAALWAETGSPTPTAFPAMRFPEILSGDRSDEILEQFPGCGVVFRFPFHERLDEDQRQDLGALLLGLPLTAVLFLKHLDEVEVEVVSGENHATRLWSIHRELIGEDGLAAPVAGMRESGTYRVRITEDGETSDFLVVHDADVQIGPHRTGLVGPAWEGVEVTEVSVAIPGPGTDTEISTAARRFHVFLPTEEICGYPFLVNGAFATDLARQHVRVTHEATDYNAHLIRVAAGLFRDLVVPELSKHGATTVLAALERTGEGGAASQLLHEVLIDALAQTPILPTPAGALLRLSEAVFPPRLLGEDGASFRGLLNAEAKHADLFLPSEECCTGRWSQIAADHGAKELRATEAASVLAQCMDSESSCLRQDPDRGVEIDPVLEMCALLWERSDLVDRQALQEQVRTDALFPLYAGDGRTVERVALGTDTAFFPPRSARQDLPLQGLRFMYHGICWGALLPKERTAVLGEHLRTWAGLFDIKEFRFEEVVRAAVLPALVRGPGEAQSELRESLEDLGALVAVCQLAGSQARPDRPLRYQRLHSDRALFNLSRLPVPVRTESKELKWVPAYRVYFGADWIGEDSIESLASALPQDGAAFDFLASPEVFRGLLQVVDEAVPGTQPSDDDEVDVDEDTDQALESSEDERWVSFLSWIGVSRALRLVHFHDVEDSATGWLTTKDLLQPRGWAFRDLGEEWTGFASQLRERVTGRPDSSKTFAYFYEAHDLDQAGAFLAASEQDAKGVVAGRLLEHLARHWSTSFGPKANVQLALVGREKWPGSRSNPPRAGTEELVEMGDDLWLFRLRQRGVFPSTFGPRKASAIWLASAELDRRFSGARRKSADWLPVLVAPSEVPGTAVRAVCDRVGVRPELSPSTFTVKDAVVLCEQIQRIYEVKDRHQIEADLRSVIRPIYRQLFELLSGRATGNELGVLSEAPLLADGPAGLKFLPAKQVLYARTPGLRERSGVSKELPCFVLEAEPGANRPLTVLFGVRPLETALQWTPDPGESALPAEGIQKFRDGLNSVANPLLARIRAERLDPRDDVQLRSFMARVEPVAELVVACEIDGRVLNTGTSRSYFVVDADSPSFVLWNGPAWPPESGDAQSLAMAFADLLGMNLVETFLAFLTASPEQQLRLLALAGATTHLADVIKAQGEPETDDAELAVIDQIDPLERTAAPGADSKIVPATKKQDGLVVAAPRIPLVSFDALSVEGDVKLLAGLRELGNASEDGHGRSPAGASSGGSQPSRQHAPAGTDLTELDNLGMAIVMAFERQRMLRDGAGDVTTLASPGESVSGRNLVLAVHTPAAIKAAETRSDIVKGVLRDLAANGVSLIHPGFDVLSIRNGIADRAIELKSSGVDARVQEMSWNEWKSASRSTLRDLFYLYLVGNLRADLPGVPFLRAIHNPFDTMRGEEVIHEQTRRVMQLRVREFPSAEHLDLIPAEGTGT